MKTQIFKGIAVFIGVLSFMPVSANALTINEQIQSLLNQVKILQERLQKIESSKQKINIPISQKIETLISTSTTVTSTEVFFSTTTIKNGVQETITESRLRNCEKWSFYYEFEEKPLFCNLPK